MIMMILPDQTDVSFRFLVVVVQESKPTLGWILLLFQLNNQVHRQG